jgi:hypothetical protein
MTTHISDAQHKAFLKRIKEEPGYAKQLLRRVMGPPRRELVGEEYDKIWTLLQLLEPSRQSNNQRTWTEEFRIGEKRYDVTYGVFDNPEIQEVDEDS